MSLRFTRRTHQVVLHCFIRDVFLPLAKKRGLSSVVYEDGYYDPIDFSGHFTRAFTWHSPLRAFKYAGRKYGSAADLNVTPTSRERAFFLSELFHHSAYWGIASRFEGGTHAHLDCGGDERFGDSASLHSQSTHIGSPNFAATGNPIAIDGNWGANTWRKVQKVAGLPITGNGDAATVRWIQSRCGAKQDGAFGPATAAALAKRVGTKVSPRPGGTNQGNTAVQIYLMLNRAL
ncbi:peptidoglycan-binding domain-containing protein [Luteipulveratus mongoliensis]|uniref:Uncharacterized protein n=1 Tax=Luteipulveratus mongoliensis TaxID=571913 RepID=A0A0K1JGB3_9MICO|nr:peptidoglycan-binding domain-containing protein [Luteipulveratus mongoliensis]AKU15736.1 hypothetical protein VV02_07545 [Luteipulveratus mongoliensis]